MLDNYGNRTLCMGSARPTNRTYSSKVALLLSRTKSHLFICKRDGKKCLSNIIQRRDMFLGAIVHMLNPLLIC